MRIIEKMQDEVAILSLQGKLVGSPETDELYDNVKSLLDRKLTNIVLDLRSVSWMGSMGIGAIMRCLMTVRNDGGDLRISGLTDKLESLFSITQIIGVIKTFKSINLAVDSFK
jgi:anti-sigma B factor antagonist